MMMLRKLFSFLNNAYLLRNPKHVMKFSGGYHNWRPLRNINFRIKNNEIVSDDAVSRFSIKYLSRFNNSLVNVTDALTRYRIYEKDGDLFFSPKICPEVSFHLQRFDNINASNEIFYEGLYNVQLRKPATVIDVGANVGVAAIYFSRLPFVSRVIAFEPFPGSWKKALENVAVNRAENVEVHNVGLSGNNAEIDVPDVEEGFMGASTTDFFIREQRKLFELPSSTITIRLRKASDRLRDILQARDQVFLLKLDCEGAEYEIIEDLEQAGLLDKFAGVIIEWHFKGAAELNKRLEHAGFSLLNVNRDVGSPMGMIYAFKNGS